MKALQFFRPILAVATVLMLVPLAAGQQNEQSAGTIQNTGTTGTTSSKTINGSETARSSAVVNSGSRSRDNLLFPRLPYISGKVLMADGAETPLGIVIEQNCGGQTVRVSNPAPNGTFGYQMGRSDLIPDASTNGTEYTLGTGRQQQQIQSRNPVFMKLIYMDCTLRASLGGYRSTSVRINLNESSANMLDVGGIILASAKKAAGTTVSVTSLKAPKDAVKRLERAEDAMAKNNLKDAEKHLNTALKEYPDYAAAWHRMGQVYRRTGRLPEARQAQAKALELDKVYVPPYLELAQIAATEHHWQDTADFSNTAVSLDPIDFPYGYYLNAVANFNLGNSAESESAARHAQRIDVNHRVPQVYLLLAAISQQRMDRQAEIAQLKSYLMYAPKDSDVQSIRDRLEQLQRRIP